MEHGGNPSGIYERYSGLKPEGQVLDLSANISPLGMPAQVREAAELAVRESIGYPDPEYKSLIRAILDHCRFTYGADLSAEHIVCGNGAADLIFRLVQAAKPRRALICCPAFSEYEQALKQSGAEISYYVSAITDLQVQEDLFQKIVPGLDLVFLCNPSNPAGNQVDQGLLKHLLVRTAQLGIRLVIDECFMDFSEDGISHSLISKLSQNQHILVLKSLTKMYGMAGLRLGYLLCTDEELVQEIKGSGQPWPVSLPAQNAGIAALKLLGYPAKVRAYVGEQRAVLEEALRSKGLRVYESRVNYLLFQVSEPEDFYEQMLRMGLVLRRCGDYRGLDDTFYRIAVGTKESNSRFLCGLQEIFG